MPTPKHAPKVVLAVLRHGDGWRVFGPNAGSRRFAYKVDAEEAAIRIASQARPQPTLILVQNQYGELRPMETEPLAP